MNYRTAIVSTLAEIGEAAWSDLLARQQDAKAEANPFLSYAFLHALHESGCASADTGWQPNYLALWQGETLAAALPGSSHLVIRDGFHSDFFIEYENTVVDAIEAMRRDDPH